MEDITNIPEMAQIAEQGRDYRAYNYPSQTIERYSTEKVSDASKVLAALFALAHAADWAQTQHIARNPDKYYEKEVDWAIGKHPSEGRVNSFMALEGLLKGVGPFMLPRGYRETAQGLALAGKLKVINQNKNIGIGLNF